MLESGSKKLNMYKNYYEKRINAKGLTRLARLAASLFSIALIVICFWLVYSIFLSPDFRVNLANTGYIITCLILAYISTVVFSRNSTIVSKLFFPDRLLIGLYQSSLAETKLTDSKINSEHTSEKASPDKKGIAENLVKSLRTTFNKIASGITLEVKSQESHLSAFGKAILESPSKSFPSERVVVKEWTKNSNNQTDLIFFAKVNSTSIFIELINDYMIYVHLANMDGTNIDVKASLGKAVSDLKSLEFRDLLILHMYLEAFRDDRDIDEEESNCLQAFKRLLGVSENAASKILTRLYRSILNVVISDNKISLSEKKMLANLTKKSGILDSDIYPIKHQLIDSKYNQLLDLNVISQNDIDCFEQICRELEIEQEIISNYLLNLVRMAFISACREHGTPTVNDCPINTNGEAVYYWAKVRGFKKKIVRNVSRNHIGTKVNIGNTPIYLGRSSPSVAYETELQPLGVGTIVLAENRIIVAGETSSINIKYEKILDIKHFEDGVMFLYDGRYNGHAYQIIEGDAWKLNALLALWLKF